MSYSSIDGSLQAVPATVASSRTTYQAIRMPRLKSFIFRENDCATIGNGDGSA